MEVEPLYTLLTLFALFTLLILFIYCNMVQDSAR